MGDYLLVSWLSTRRGLIVFILLVLMTAFSNLYRLAPNRGNDNQPFVASNNLKSSQREGGQRRLDGKRVNKHRHPPNPVKSAPSH